MAHKKNNSGRQNVTWAQATRDIVIAAINRGQLLLLGVLAIFMLLVFKMPDNKAYELARAIFNDLKNFSLLGYILFLVMVIFCYSHSKKLRKNHSLEFERIGREKSRLQDKLAGEKLSSSEGH